MIDRSVNYLVKTFKIIFYFIMFVLILRSFIVEPGKVNGLSMESNFKDNEFFLVDKISLLFILPQRGDVIQFYKEDEKAFVIKRIIGLPGEQVKIFRNKVFIIDKNNVEWQLREPYLDKNIITRGEKEGTFISEVIPSNEYFLLGDNREKSIDSRKYGLVHRKFILGKVFRIKWFNKK